MTPQTANKYIKARLKAEAEAKSKIDHLTQIIDKKKKREDKRVEFFKDLEEEKKEKKGNY
jgi:hypothetical protein